MSHENVSLPCSLRPLPDLLFQRVAGPEWSLGTRPPGGPVESGPTTSLALGKVAASLASLQEAMSITDMTDTGMWIWAGVLTVVGLVTSWLIALAWLRWRRESQKKRA